MNTEKSKVLYYLMKLMQQQGYAETEIADMIAESQIN